MPLLKDGKVADDAFTNVAAEASIPAEGAVIVSLAQWREGRDALLGRGTPLGIQLAPGESPSEIEADLEHFAVVALLFPAFTDGRAYSHARLLRERMGYTGEVRAVGDVLLEQLHFMHRSGFDAYQIESEHAVEDWQTAQADMSVFYQPTGDGRATAMRRRHA